jgi:hypothetical protein
MPSPHPFPSKWHVHETLLARMIVIDTSQARGGLSALIAHLERGGNVFMCKPNRVGVHYQPYCTSEPFHRPDKPVTGHKPRYFAIKNDARRPIMKNQVKKNLTERKSCLTAKELSRSKIVAQQRH